MRSDNLLLSQMCLTTWPLHSKLLSSLSYLTTLLVKVWWRGFLCIWLPATCLYLVSYVPPPLPISQPLFCLDWPFAFTLITSVCCLNRHWLIYRPCSACCLYWLFACLLVMFLPTTSPGPSCTSHFPERPQFQPSLLYILLLFPVITDLSLLSLHRVTSALNTSPL